MRAFRFGFDRLCLAACAAYFLNRCFLKPLWPSAFLHGTFNDLLLIPAALPWVLWIHRRLGLRKSDAFPSAGEILGHLVVWAAIAEGVMPLVSARFTADWLDVAVYAVGAAAAAGLWRLEARRPACTDFDKLAPIYDHMEDLLAGGLMMRVRVAFFSCWPEEGEVLLVGEGHGRFLRHLRKARPQLRITCLDSSARMLSVARRRLRRTGLSEGNITFVQADFRTWKPGMYDVISTQFFLDCFDEDELRAVARKLAQAARPAAVWSLADFQIPPHGFARIRARIIVWLMYRFFRTAVGISAPRLESPLQILQEQGFREQFRQEWSLGLLYSSWLTRDWQPDES